ncbi:DUF4395 domain-containing protein [Herbiconiux sp. KACC 21604]|uniref:DUF4395 domain-containing protein n=1 Tax=unclassified Herbiconiux TaxID=2618217 RepID=UPI00149280FC|nr:DUF4395 domain-containing protein [Herbiconiux sp. SALV-R1]QJU53717.1 DUF4395 domain-containing protein [Herbiconiux sp. SALV-R1]WPO84721.1 DUF4395 domain-containing protein [Herbiconiux sp. KACC 21604]
MIDPRAPRFAAGITALLLLVVVALGFAFPTGPEMPLEARILNPAFALLTAIALLFLWGAAAGVKRHPFGVLFRELVRPRLAPPAELEDPRPPTFAQLVGLVVTGAGLLLAAVGVPWALVVAASLAFVAAFLNAVFGYCLGCQIYLLLVRLRPVRA